MSDPHKAEDRTRDDDVCSHLRELLQGAESGQAIRLTVKLRGRAPTPDGAEGAQFLSARGAKPIAPHGLLQRWLDGMPPTHQLCEPPAPSALIFSSSTYFARPFMLSATWGSLNSPMVAT